MKASFAVVGTTFLVLAYSKEAQGFSLAPRRLSSTQQGSSLSMFSGGGAGAAKEDNPEEEENLAKTAAAMGMQLEEFKLVIAAQARFAEIKDNMIVSGGKSDSVFVERDINNPPKKFDITITVGGKAKGKENVAKELVAALKFASDEARKGREEAQEETRRFIFSQAKP